QGVGGTNLGTWLERIWIGKLYGLDADNDNQFKTGILFSGAVNGDSNTITHVRITGCDDYGVDVQNANASGTHFNGLFIQSCGSGVRTNASVIGTNWFIGN